MTDDLLAATPPDAGSRYDASAIVVFSGLQAVRRNPSMYIGSTDADGLHHLVYELLDNAVDEYEAGHCRELSVTLGADGSCAVGDDGRGIPVGPHPDTGRPACEVVLTTLHAGGKFGGGTYVRSAGLHGVGLSCVNALAQWLRVDIRRDGVHHTQEYVRGEPRTELTDAGVTRSRGTTVTFRPDPEIFDTCRFSARIIGERLQEIAFLHSGLTARLVDERSGTVAEYSFDGGVRAFLGHLNSDTATVHPEPVVVSYAGDTVSFDLAFQWTEGYTEDLRGFVNGVRTDQGGAHVDGIRAALATVINRYATAHRLLDSRTGERITTVDILEGLTAVVSLRMVGPKFDGQTKKRLQNPEIRRLVQDVVDAGFTRAVETDETLGHRVVGRALDATRARLAARLASRTARHQRRELDIDYGVYQRQFGIRSKNWHDSCAWLTDEELLAKHAELCDVPPDARLLDVCCGSGVVGASFRDRVGETIGLDLTPEMVALASTRLDRVDQGTVYDLPYPDDSFDLVVTREVLHLLPQPERPVSEIFRVLRPGGQFIVGQIVPFADEDAFWMYRVFKKKQPLLYQMFREEDFRSLLVDAGFTGVRMTEYLLWESIDQWIDTHETTPAHRREIQRLFYEAPREVREVHPFEILPDGSIRDQWRWCVYSLRKPW
ncbi:recombinase RmuC [Streptomyces carminius]|uniref:DNA topoisomerase (ATP-hydrolyzing) n=1 Tax=Streptomyces carminius TaxID=2665496 RepID=A0A2M8MBP2_9ACTN|nr:methyltransferase domain-containing protein [Streptomyces carminius]PJF01610.1 recombinase RmuC [Streptomyces carminius]